MGMRARSSHVTSFLARGRRAFAVFAVLAALAAGSAFAAETEWWVSDSASDYAKAESRGVVVDPEGVLSLGPALREWRSDSVGVIWSLAPLPDGSVAVAGDRGRIDRWTESGGFRPWVSLGNVQVLALAADGDGVVAGTAPGGAVYRVAANGDTTLLARTGERYVWGLAPAGGGAWYAATGTKGRLLKVSRGAVRVMLDSDESNLVSIVSDGKGGCFAGGDSKGRVFHVRADGSTRTVFDAAEDEVRALAIGRDGALYAAGLSGSAVASGSSGGGDDDRPQPAKSAVGGARSTVYRIVPDSSVVSWWVASQPMIFALAQTPLGFLAATGNAAGISRIDRAGGATQLALFPQGQITALAVTKGGAVIAAGSNPGAVWKLGPERAARGELISPAQDLKRIAQFGRVRWHGEGGGVRIETRSGNCDPPDTTWSRWSGGAVSEAGAEVAAPPARYLQWKIVLDSPATRVSSVEIATRERNLAPSIEDLVVAPQGVAFREGELTPRMESVTQTLPGGQKVEYSMPSASTPKQLRELPMWALGLRTLQWRGVDPNGDPLTYRVEVRPEGGRDWIEIGKDLTNSTFTWDTRGLPDGRYRIRVTASDRATNPLGEEGTAVATSAPFVVDNSPPRIEKFDANGVTGAVSFSGQAADGENVLTRVEVALDDDVWRQVAPEGGLTDSRDVRFSGRWPDVTPGDHTLSVRVVDAGGNPAVRSVHVTVPGRASGR